MADILKLGVPIGIAIFLEMAMFAVVSFLIAALGVIPMAAHSIAGNLNWLTYVIPMSMGSAAGIRIGFLVGSNDLKAARITAGAVLKFATVYALVVSVLLIIFRVGLVQVYTTDVQVIEMAAALLIIIAVYQLVDDTQAVMIGSLRLQGYNHAHGFQPSWVLGTGSALRLWLSHRHVRRRSPRGLWLLAGHYRRSSHGRHTGGAADFGP